MKTQQMAEPNPTRPYVLWTPESRALLAKLWADPETSQEMAARQLGHDVRSCRNMALKCDLGPKVLTGKTHGYWLDDTRVATLVELWDSGVSATKIAEHFFEVTGIRISRNAVLGKLDRMGMRRYAASKPKAAPEPRRAPAEKRLRLVPPPKHVLISTPLTSGPWMALEGSSPREFPVGRGECNWPLDDATGEFAPGVLRCCEPALRAYCPTHDTMAHAPRAAKTKPDPARPFVPTKSFAEAA
jgi:hypothetical protein